MIGLLATPLERGKRMKHGIYYAFWENEWNADFRYYIEKAAKIGFDVLQIATHHINAYNAQQLTEIRQCAKDNGIILTAGIGPSKDRNLSSPDAAVRKAGDAFFRETLTNIAKLDVHLIGGALYSYWPIDYSKPVDKIGDRARGIEGIAGIADFANDLGINLCMEVLNRFENHVLNTAADAVFLDVPVEGVEHAL